eukprot:4287305-Amphidinium_carterae.5
MVLFLTFSRSRFSDAQRIGQEPQQNTSMPRPAGLPQSFTPPNIVQPIAVGTGSGSPDLVPEPEPKMR